MTLNSKTEYINDVPYEMDVAPVIVDNRTLAPARYVAEAFGYFVNYYCKSKNITYPLVVTSIISLSKIGAFIDLHAIFGNSSLKK